MSVSASEIDIEHDKLPVLRVGFGPEKKNDRIRGRQVGVDLWQLLSGFAPGALTPLKFPLTCDVLVQSRNYTW